jgi:hypothetical protein
VRGRYIDVLIVDERTARSVLEAAGPAAEGGEAGPRP